MPWPLPGRGWRRRWSASSRRGAGRSRLSLSLRNPSLPLGADRRRLEAPKNLERRGDQPVEVLVGESGPRSFDGDRFLEPDPGLASFVLIPVRKLDLFGKQIRAQDEYRQRLLRAPLEAALGVLGRPHVVRIERRKLFGLGDLVGALYLCERSEGQGSIVGEVRDPFHE